MSKTREEASDDWVYGDCEIMDTTDSHRQSFIAGWDARNSEVAELKARIETLTNPSDGRCMEIQALRNSNAELRSRVQKLEIEVSRLSSKYTLCGPSPKTEGQLKAEKASAEIKARKELNLELQKLGVLLKDKLNDK